MQQFILSKTLVASSSNFLGSFSSAATTLYTTGATASVGTASGAVATLLDTQRRIGLWSTAADQTSLLVTLTGLNDNSDPVTETITGSSALTTITRTTLQDFKSITSVSFSSAPLEGAIHLGTTTKGGTPWILADTWRNPFDVTAVVTLTATGNSVATNFEFTLEDITQATLPGPNKVISTSPGTIVPWYPTPVISQVAGSTLLSTAIDATTMGTFTTPFAAWRVTMTASSSTAATAGISVLQAG